MIKDNLVFLREFVKDFQSTGTVWPTSHWAAEALAVPLRDRNGSGARKVLELGPGTGSVTTQILSQLRTGDEFTICEINPSFLKRLREKLEKDQHYLLHRERIRFFEGPVQSLPEDTRYDLIVCALPFLNFDLPTVEEIFSKLKRVSNVHAHMTYYEYIGLRAMGRLVSPPKRRQRLNELDIFFSALFKGHLSDQVQVWANILPVYIYHLKHMDEIPVGRSDYYPQVTYEDS